jgi:hypothetical protein
MTNSPNALLVFAGILRRHVLGMQHLASIHERGCDVETRLDHRNGNPNLLPQNVQKAFQPDAGGGTMTTQGGDLASRYGQRPE